MRRARPGQDRDFEIIMRGDMECDDGVRRYLAYGVRKFTVTRFKPHCAAMLGGWRNLPRTYSSK